jgi:ADP-ribose pyrophosphatase
MIEKTVASTKVYDGKIIKVKVDDVELPNGKTAKREIVNHPGAVAVMAITEENKMIMVRQFRKPLERMLIEIPAGKLEPGEEPAVCAHRELQEETGYTCQQLRHQASFYTSPGFADEIVHLYRAENIQPGPARPDEDEFVELIHVTLEEAEQLIANGDIRDAKTILAVYAWKLDARK